MDSDVAATKVTGCPLAGARCAGAEVVTPTIDADLDRLVAVGPGATVRLHPRTMLERSAAGIRLTGPLADPVHIVPGTHTTPADGQHGTVHVDLHGSLSRHCDNLDALGRVLRTPMS